MLKKHILLCFCLVSLLPGCERGVGRYVDPNIGGVAPLLTTVVPQVHRPNSMARVFPVTETGLNDRYFSDRIYGIALNMPRYRLGTTSSLLPVSGDVEFETASSWYDHDVEVVTPWSHKLHLQDYDIDAQWTATERCVVFRFRYNDPDKEAGLLFRLTGKGNVEVDGNVVKGWESIDYARQYFHAVIEGDFQCRETSGAGALLSAARTDGYVTVKVGLSYISDSQACANLAAEVGDKDFCTIEDESRKIWEDALGKIKVEGGTEREKRIFYTSLYRTYDRMVCHSEYGRYYSGFDKQVHEDERDFYNDDWAWDTYRNLHALGFILDPERKADELQSYARMYRQWGWVPQFPELTEWGGDWFEGANKDWHGEPMIGNHVASIAAEAIRKGVVDFDIETLYEGLRKNALEGTLVPWRAGRAREIDNFYHKNGFFPALAPGEDEKYDYIDHGWEKRQAVSVTIEQSYDDWCLAQIAKYLGKDDDYEILMRRSRNYLNLWNEQTGWFAPKNEKGEWIEPFDPQLCDGFGARSYFAEVGAYVHLFHIQHDIEGMIELLGGAEEFVRRIDHAYNKGPQIDKWKFMGRMPDATGLQGMIPAGNEPAFHIPWLYNYAGYEWKTQHRVRQIADVWFDDRVTGLSGDEDGGALCAWYVFAAMGFYPVNPVSGEYALSSPIFRKVEIELPDGETFVIKAPSASKKNKYIKEIRLNGKALERPFITHEDITGGGVLEFDLTDRPQ